jgi:ceramide glucosyltransferase
MTLPILRWLILAMALAPFVYYLLSIYCALEFFRPRRRSTGDFQPPVSILKPVRGLDREAYENFASFCRQDYATYEILFAVSDADDPIIPVIERLIRDFPERSIRLLIGAEPLGPNSKVCKLCRLVRESRFDLLVISDSDVRVEPDYLRAVAGAFRDPQVGAVTMLFRGMVDDGLGSQLDCVGSSAEFCAAAIVARQLEGVKFTLGATMATTRERLAEIGGFEALVEFHSDDFELGNRIAGRGYRVEILADPVWMVYPAQSVGAYLRHELRWAIGLRHIRPWGHFGLLFTHGLPLSLAAAAVAPSALVGGLYIGAYFGLRLLMAWTVGVRGLRDPVLRSRLWLVPLRDAFAFYTWVASFFTNRIQWRCTEFEIREGRLHPAADGPPSAAELKH